MSELDLRRLPLEELQDLAIEIRQTIISACLRNGGHLGASLGAVELAIALHRVFESPREPIVWDVGHQAYAHKILTGRGDRFGTLRKWNGLSGFLSREESEHDVFGAGHSSTSLSAALALAWARGREEKTRQDWTVAVIGDGGLTAGLALEALNQVAGLPIGPLLIVLNDNQMSISPNVGGVAALLGQGRAEEFARVMGCEYVGPIDGHDLSLLVGTLQGVRESGAEAPIFLHVLTQKGKGYAPAEDHPADYHGVSPVKAASVEKTAPAAAPAISYSDVMGRALCELAESDPSIVAVTAAMAEGTGLSEFTRRFTERSFDVGIAEPHAVTFAAGLGTQGLKPLVAIYSTFLQRGIDGIIHDVALQSLPVVFGVDRAGLVGADGPTHHGVFDLAYLSMIPGLTLLAPATAEDLRAQLGWALGTRAPAGPVAIRYPRGSAPEGRRSRRASENLELRWNARPGRGRKPAFYLLALGAAESRAEAAWAGLSEREAGRGAFATVLRAKPLPAGLVRELRGNPGAPIVWVEDGVRRGGIGEALLGELGARRGAWVNLGYPDRFVAHGSVAEQERAIGVSSADLLKALRRVLKG